MTDNQSITPQARSVIETLDRFVTRPDVRLALQQAEARAREQLHREPDAAEASARLDLAGLAEAAPALIGSARVVVTRGTGGQRIERHANSTQYLWALDGAVETHLQTEGGWRVDRYGQGDPAVLENRWHIVPPGVWHKSVGPAARVWSIAAFHSARDVNDEYR